MRILDCIIFENDNFIVFNKPSGLPVHGGSHIFFNLVSFLKKKLIFDEKYIELCHRLDKNTSGCLLLAKNLKYLNFINFLLKNNKIKKEYHALIKGFLPKIHESVFFCNFLNNYNVKIKNNLIVTKNLYFTLQKFSSCSLIKIIPFSGKTHQIRMHLSMIGNPIANDFKYGSKFFNNNLNYFKFKRMFLHANSIKFFCPFDKKFYFFKAEYSIELICILKNLELL